VCDIEGPGAGCGLRYGDLLVLFASVPGVAEVVAVDTGEGFLAARDVASGIDLPVRFVRADFLGFPREGGFDRAAFLWVLHDRADPRPFLERALKVLSPAGAITVGDVDFGELREGIRDFGAGSRSQIAGSS